MLPLYCEVTIISAGAFVLVFNAHLETPEFVSVQGFSEFHRSLTSKDGKSNSLTIPYFTGGGKIYTIVSDSVFCVARHSLTAGKYNSL